MRMWKLLAALALLGMLGLGITGGGFAQQDEAPAGEEESPFANVNPYTPDAGASAAELEEFLKEAPEKPSIIRTRAAFQEAIVLTAERLLAAEDATDAQQTVALASLFRGLDLQKQAGDEKAAAKLLALAEKYADDQRSAVAEEAKLALLESKLDAVDLTDAEAMADMLTELTSYFRERKGELTDRHLNLASATVKLMNTIPDSVAAVDAYLELGELFAESEDRQLSRYGQRIKKYGEKLAITTKPIELDGQLLSGEELDWSKYKGKVVLVEFWATWCGPCIAELPNLKAAYEKYHDKGFEIVGISVDQDEDALREFVTEKQIPWPIVYHFPQDDEEKSPLAQKFNVRGIPTCFLVGPDGKIVHTRARGPELERQLEKLLGKPNEKAAE